MSAVGLPKLDVLSQSDPIAVLYELLPNDSEREIARTEIVGTFTLFLFTSSQMPLRP